MTGNGSIFINVFNYRLEWCSAFLSSKAKGGRGKVGVAVNPGGRGVNEPMNTTPS